MGVWADWDQPYLTLQPAYEAAQLRVFAAMFKRGSIYQGLNPSGTRRRLARRLAEAELEYPDGTVAGVPWRLLDASMASTRPHESLRASYDASTA